MKPYIYIRILLLVATSLLLAGCGKDTEKKYKIGLRSAAATTGARKPTRTCASNSSTIRHCTARASASR